VGAERGGMVREEAEEMERLMLENKVHALVRPGE
jgi:hypothetical protein